MAESRLYLAPMEDVTDPAFRMLCKRYGADRVYTEFVNADALVRDIASTTRKLTIHDAERPVAIQIYGREPEAMADAARIVETAKPDFIDINFGCPVKKVAGKGAGAGLLKDVPKMLEIAKAVVNAVHIPVTAKTRLGWDESDLLPLVAEGCGILDGGLPVDVILVEEQVGEGFRSKIDSLRSLEEVGRGVVEAHQLGEVHVAGSLSRDDVLSADRPEYKSFLDFHIVTFSLIQLLFHGRCRYMNRMYRRSGRIPCQKWTRRSCPGL